MHQPFTIDYLNLLLSISDAIDLASPRLSQHQIRTAFICWEMAKVAQVSTSDIDDLFVAALMHDIGALSPEEKINLHQEEVHDPDRHCLLGERLLAGVPSYVRIARIVRYHHTPWHCPGTLSQDDTLLTQILYLADYIERLIDRDQYILHQVEEISTHVQDFTKTSLPELLSLYQTVARREDFWLDVVSPRLYSLLYRVGPCRNKVLDLAELKIFARLYRNMIDFRSHFTATHSAGVAAAAVALAELVGMTEVECEMMDIAGSLHDLGKLAIPNSILMKPAKLTPEEYAIIRQHTYCTYSVLMTIGGITHIAEWAAFHHERLDGQGYPFHVSAKAISLGARIMAVADILTALTEERPYRVGLPQDQVLGIIQRQVENQALDARLVGILHDNYTAVVSRMLANQQEAKAHYEREFAALTLESA